MFVQLFCKDRNQKEKDELYQVLGAIAHRENVQIEERGDVVEIDVCPQGKIIVHEEDREVILSANTRHAGAGFHAFCVDIFMDIQQELNGEFELVDDLEFDQDGNFHRLHHLYEDENLSSIRTIYTMKLTFCRWKKRMRLRHRSVISTPKSFYIWIRMI